MDLNTVEVDAQRVMKVARQTHKDTGVKKKKMEGAAMYNGQGLLDFLTVKVLTYIYTQIYIYEMMIIIMTRMMLMMRMRMRMMMLMLMLIIDFLLVLQFFFFSLYVDGSIAWSAVNHSNKLWRPLLSCVIED